MSIYDDTTDPYDGESVHGLIFDHALEELTDDMLRLWPIPDNHEVIKKWLNKHRTKVLHYLQYERGKD